MVRNSGRKTNLSKDCSDYCLSNDNKGSTFALQVLHGVFEAVTCCAWNLKPDAFARGRGGGSSPYPCQVPHFFQQAHA